MRRTGFAEWWGRDKRPAPAIFRVSMCRRFFFRVFKRDQSHQQRATSSVPETGERSVISRRGKESGS